MSDCTVTFTDHEIKSCGLPNAIALLEEAHCYGTAALLQKIATETAPRIPEPGLWGVVEASWDSRSDTGIPRAEWMRVKGNLWHSTISAVAVRWDDLIDPTLVRDGLAP